METTHMCAHTHTHTLISTAHEETFDKIQHLFIIKKQNKTLKLLGKEEYLNIIRAVCVVNPTSNIMLKSEILRASPLRQGGPHFSS